MKLLFSFMLLLPGVVLAQQKFAGINQINIPPFVRQGDQPLCGFQLFNNSKKDWTGTVHFQLLDTIQQQSVDGWFYNHQGNQYFLVEPSRKEWIEFPIHIPFEFSKPTAWELRIKTDTSTTFTSGMLQIEPWNYSEEATTPVSNPDWPQLIKKTSKISTQNGSVQKELLIENALVTTGDTLLVEIELTKNKSNKVVLIEQWPAGTLPNMVRSLGTHAGTGKVLQLNQQELHMECWVASDSTLKLSYQLIATFVGRFYIPPAVISSPDQTPSFLRSSYSTLTIEQQKLP